MRTRPDDDVRPVEDLVEGRAGEGGEVDPATAADHHGPGRRGVGAGERGEELLDRGEVGAEAAVAGRHRHPEAARGRERVEQVARASCRAASTLSARAVIVGASASAAATTSAAVVSMRRVMLDPTVRTQHRRLGGVPSPQRGVPAAVAVAERLGDPAVAHLAEPQPPSHLVAVVSSCSTTNPVAVGTTRSSRALTAADPGDRRKLRCEGLGPCSWNRQNGGSRSKNASGAKSVLGRVKVSKQRLNAVAEPLVRRASVWDRHRSLLLARVLPGSTERPGRARDPAGESLATDHPGRRAWCVRPLQTGPCS